MVARLPDGAVCTRYATGAAGSAPHTYVEIRQPGEPSLPGKPSAPWVPELPGPLPLVP